MPEKTKFPPDTFHSVNSDLQKPIWIFSQLHRPLKNQKDGGSSGKDDQVMPVTKWSSMNDTTKTQATHGQRLSKRKVEQEDAEANELFIRFPQLENYRKSTGTEFLDRFEKFMQSENFSTSSSDDAATYYHSWDDKVDKEKYFVWKEFLSGAFILGKDSTLDWFQDEVDLFLKATMTSTISTSRDSVRGLRKNCKIKSCHALQATMEMDVVALRVYLWQSATLDTAINLSKLLLIFGNSFTDLCLMDYFPRILGEEEEQLVKSAVDGKIYLPLYVASGYNCTPHTDSRDCLLKQPKSFDKPPTTESDNYMCSSLPEKHIPDHSYADFGSFLNHYHILDPSYANFEGPHDFSVIPHVEENRENDIHYYPVDEYCAAEFELEMDNDFCMEEEFPEVGFETESVADHDNPTTEEQLTAAYHENCSEERLDNDRASESESLADQDNLMAQQQLTAFYYSNDTPNEHTVCSRDSQLAEAVPGLSTNQEWTNSRALTIGYSTYSNVPVVKRRWREACFDRPTKQAIKDHQDKFSWIFGNLEYEAGIQLGFGTFFSFQSSSIHRTALMSVDADVSRLLGSHNLTAVVAPKDQMHKTIMIFTPDSAFKYRFQILSLWAAWQNLLFVNSDFYHIWDNKAELEPKEEKRALHATAHQAKLEEDRRNSTLPVQVRVKRAEAPTSNANRASDSVNAASAAQDANDVNNADLASATGAATTSANNRASTTDAVAATKVKPPLSEKQREKKKRYQKEQKAHKLARIRLAEVFTNIATNANGIDADTHSVTVEAASATADSTNTSDTNDTSSAIVDTATILATSSNTEASANDANTNAKTAAKAKAGASSCKRKRANFRRLEEPANNAETTLTMPPLPRNLAGRSQRLKPQCLLLPRCRSLCDRRARSPNCTLNTRRAVARYLKPCV
ncbi:hypothetical protein DFJ73DRAFT_909466 [Zopfochytrium polystomum]|nr:hypothetical protein DFJ73DRAFT_909466 [Zopfochytrium polystomum]